MPNENRRCPCGCGIFMPLPEDMPDHYDTSGLCLLCGRSTFSSSLNNGEPVEDRHGNDMEWCPLCHYFIIYSQLERHAQMVKLVESTLKTADASIELLLKQRNDAYEQLQWTKKPV